MRSQAKIFRASERWFQNWFMLVRSMNGNGIFRGKSLVTAVTVVDENVVEMFTLYIGVLAKIVT